MPEVTYTVGIMGGDSSLLYSGELVVAFESDSFGLVPHSGVLSLNSFPPLPLSAAQGVSAWTFSGSSDDLSISTTSIYSMEEFVPTPTRFVGYVSLSANGAPEQMLPFFGFNPEPPPPHPPVIGGGGGTTDAAAARADTGAGRAPGAGAATASAGVTSYNYQLAVFDNSFARVNGGSLSAIGVWLPAPSPEPKKYMVTGDLTLGAGPSGMSLLGQSGPTYLDIRSEQPDPPVALIAVVSPQGLAYSAGNLTLGFGDSEQQFFFVGSPPASGTKSSAGAKSKQSPSPAKSASSGKSSPSSKSSSSSKPASSSKASRGGGKRGG